MLNPVSVLLKDIPPHPPEGADGSQGKSRAISLVCPREVAFQSGKTKDSTPGASSEVFFNPNKPTVLRNMRFLIKFRSIIAEQ